MAMDKNTKRKAHELPPSNKIVGGSLFATQATELDPNLSSLFTVTPLQSHVEDATTIRKRKRSQPSQTVVAHQENSSVDTTPEGPLTDSVSQSSEDDTTAEAESSELSKVSLAANRKPTINERKRQRRRQDAEDDLEAQYMSRLAREEEKESQQRQAERRMANGEAQADSESDGGVNSVVEDRIDGNSDADIMDDMITDEEQELSPPPQHETATGGGEKATELEKSARTCFLANIAVSAITSKTAQKTLRAHLSSFIDKLPSSHPPHKIESLRFRSTAYDNKLPKKAAFVKKELKEATSKSTNAYVVYSTQVAAREAARRLNGTVVLDRHLRVDQVAHPAKVDHKRCVFVGNLDFVDDDAAIREGNDNLDDKTKNRKKTPGDVEEGLWRQFGKAGTVESVRVVRDPKTRVGKGFAYVQFTDENAVEAALLYNEQKFPPLLPRKIRVSRAKAEKRSAKRLKETQQARGEMGNPNNSRVYNPKFTPEQAALRGRASKLLGRAGAAQVQKGKGGPAAVGFKTPETFVFEGHRATASQGNRGLRLGGKAKRKGGKPAGRSGERAAAWKASGGKKAQ